VTCIVDHTVSFAIRTVPARCPSAVTDQRRK